MESWEGSQLNKAKEILAYELTNLVHGPEEAKKAQDGARALFQGGAAAEIPTAVIQEEDLRDGSIDLISILVKAGLASTRNEARRAIEQGGVSVDDEVIRDVKALFAGEKLAGDGILVRKGKKNYKKVLMGA